jgi:hypothetical protein
MTQISKCMQKVTDSLAGLGRDEYSLDFVQWDLPRGHGVSQNACRNVEQPLQSRLAVGALRDQALSEPRPKGVVPASGFTALPHSQTDSQLQPSLDRRSGPR